MNITILNNDIQEFINQHLNEEPAKLILKGSSFQGVSTIEIVEQIISKKKCKTKLPTWFNTEKIYYPNKLNIEQTSSEITAKYKANLLTGGTIIDLTGGFGVDCFAFSEKFKEVTHCEINTELSKIAEHNYKLLGVQNINTIAQNGYEYLRKNKKKYDWVYADPSRRSDIKGKVFLLEDCLPDIPSNLDFIFEYTDNILLKLSPVLDITSAINELEFVKEIHVIAVNNEVKELLLILEKGYHNNINISALDIKNSNQMIFTSEFPDTLNVTYSEPKSYLYEPNAAILKAGLFNEVSHQLKLDKLHFNSHLYTSEDLLEFPGRKFKIIHNIPYNIKMIKKLIPSKKTNITTRNFPETVSQIRKRTKLKEGGNIYSFFTTDINNKHIVLICEKV
ncbi:MAG: class I SAM-dependent methyltransferase [Bacteroidota bacterium]